MSDETPPATPFLYVPKDATGRRGGEADPNAVGWIEGPGIFLLSEAGRFETAPRAGIGYRLVAAVGNAGAVSSQMTFAEFRLAMLPTNQVYPIQYIDAPLRDTWLGPLLGVTALNVPQSVAGGSLSWAMTPTWHYFRWGPEEALAVVRVSDPLHDGVGAEFDSRRDRHTAVRPLTPNLSGTWEGEEFDTAGNVVGMVRLSIEQDWDIAPVIHGATVPRYAITTQAITRLPDRPVQIGARYEDYCSTGFSFDIYNGDQVDDRWYGVLTPAADDTLTLRIDYNDSEPKTRGMARLTRIGPGTPGPDVCVPLLRQLDTSPSPTWPASRMADLAVLIEALSHL